MSNGTCTGPIVDRNEKRNSKVIVIVVDSSSLEHNALQHLLKDEQYADVEAVKLNPDIGIVETSEGLFVLDTEGCGPADPITDENPLDIGFSIDKRKGDDPNAIMLRPTVLQAQISATSLKRLPVKEKKNLGDFIRSFGRRLDANFKSWDAKLSPITA